MKKIIIYSSLLITLFSLWSCKKGSFPGAEISPYISLFDVRDLYKGQDLTLTKDNMFGSEKITGVVVSDHSGGNLPEGLLMIQDHRRLSNLRGIALSIGADANNYLPGDSVIIDVKNGVLKRVNGILEITNITNNAVTKISSGNPIPLNRVTIDQISANPDNYESTLSVIVKGGFDPLPSSTDVLSGDKVLNDGFGDIALTTYPKASFANTQAPILANFYGIVLNTVGADGQLVPQFRLRVKEDVAVLSSTVTIPPVIITGFMSDVRGADGNYEYIQMMATKDIDFAVTPFAVVETNNPNAATPTGYPANGWATGGMRTFKFNLTSGTATKGSFFYVGGTGKMINGSGSTSMSTSNWIRAFNYTTTNGDGFGTKTSGLMANSGNAFGMAVFDNIDVTVNSTPVDAIFISNGGSLYTAGPPAKGYRIANTDFYDIKNPITLEDQPFYRQGTNTLAFKYNTSDLGYFNMLGGVYNINLGRWVQAREQNNVLLTKTSNIIEIEGEGSTILK
jgi:hypothetical protein